MQALILGTSSAKPTAKRNHPGVLVEVGGKTLLIDCGEGIQRQIITARKKATRIDALLITHWHADHSAGIPALLQSMSFNEREKELLIIGPKGTKNKIELIYKIFPFRPKFKIIITEVDSKKPKKIAEDKEYEVWAVNAKHRETCIAFFAKEKDKNKIDLEYLKKFGLGQSKVLGELQKGKDIVFNNKKISHKKATYTKPGKKITYITDTQYTKPLVELAKNSDILICEATFIENDRESADVSTHMTAGEAGKLAKSSKSKKLVLTHFSTRYKSKAEHLKEAKKEFENTVLGHDFLEVKA